MEERYTKTLKNGLKVVHVPFDSIFSATFRLYGRAGSLWENKNGIGSAHFLEHVVFEGTKKYPSAERLRRVIEDIGGEFNAFTSFERVGFVARILKTDMEKGFDFLSQLVMHPNITKKAVDKHKGIIAQELMAKLDDPVTKFMLDSETAVYPKGYRRTFPIVGNLEDIAQTTPEILNDFIAKNYTANNFVLGVCASYESEKVFELAEKYFGHMTKGKKNEHTSFAKEKSMKIFARNNKELNQATLLFNFFAPKKYDKQSYAVNFLEEILGGSTISRINTEIREKRGLAYAVGAGYHDENDAGLFTVFAQIDESKYKEVVKIVKKELEKIMSKNITKVEFERTRKKIMAAFVFNNESPAKRINFYTSLALEDRDNENYESTLDNFRKVTIEDVKKAAEDIFSQKPKIRMLSKSVEEESIRKEWLK